MTAVNTQSADVQAMAEHWPVIDALMGGTPAMRDAGKTLLPQQPMEDDEAYQYRLQTATLFPAYSRTIGVMAGKPFAKEVDRSRVAAALQDFCDDVDGLGSSLHVFAAERFAGLMSHGFAGIYVDHDPVPEGATLADQKAQGARPRWIAYRHDQILGYRHSDGVLTQVRLLEKVQQPDGDFGIKVVEQVRVLEPGTWRVFQKNDKGQWGVTEEGRSSLSQVPFVFCWGVMTGPYTSKPPLLDLAYQNVKHWQEQSDQDDSTRFARKRLLVATGLTDRDPITASSQSLLTLPVGADLKIVQGAAESVTVGRSELEALEDQMIQTGAELLTKSQTTRTATEASNDAEANKSSLQKMVERFEDSLDQALQFTADYLGAGDGGHVSLFKDFASATLSDASAQLILNLGMQGKITDKTVLNELKRRAILSPDLDVEAEIDEVTAQGPAMGMIRNDPE